MRTLGVSIVLAATTLVAGCVVMPTAPMVAAMPGSQRTFEEFRSDDQACRGNAFGAVSGQGQAAANNATANAAASTAVGAAAGALIGAASGNAGTGAAIGAGTGLLFGSTAASGYGGYSSYQLQYQYDAVYLQCMYARGHRVPARFAGYGYTSRPYATRDYPAGTAAPQPGEAPAPGNAPAASGAVPRGSPSVSWPAPAGVPPYPPPNTPPPRG